MRDVNVRIQNAGGCNLRPVVRPASLSTQHAARLTGHKTRAVFGRYNIVNERELLTAGQRLAAYFQKGR